MRTRSIYRKKKPITKLIEFRKSLGLSTSELARKCNTYVGSWSQFELEKNEPHWQIFLKLQESAKQHGILLDEYLFCKEEKKDFDVTLLKTVYSLKELREYLNLSQEAMAKECGITHRTWGRYERGETDLLVSTYIKIREFARARGFELIIGSTEPMILADSYYEKPSLKLCLQV